jgi:long-chain acyl-CoA synthetase
VTAAPSYHVVGVGGLAARAAEQYGEAVAQRYPSGGTWHTRTFQELAHEVDGLASGLHARGVRAGDRVVLLSSTRPEWTLCDLAIARLGAICVPAYPTGSARQTAWVLADSGARAVVVETEQQALQVAAMRGELPCLEHVLGIDVDTADVPGIARWAGGTPLPDPAVSGEDPFTIVYTSGTTGNPKGCVLSHANVASVVQTLRELTDAVPGDVIYAYLPLAHMLTRTLQLFALETGMTIAYGGGDIRAVLDELAEVRPTYLPSVPALFEKLYAVVQQLPPDDDLGTKVREAFGGRVRHALTGSAPIAPEILAFFAACGVPIYEAYGMTESSAVISANTAEANRVGTVGRPVPGVEVRISEDGEVCARSAGVFGGYWNNAAATAETLVDGWLRTGDLGHLDADGYLTITGRKKDIIITSAGKNLAPALIENDLRAVPGISQAVMLGDRRPHPVALITVDAGLDSSDPALRARIAQAVAAVNAQYAPPERIRDFALLPRDLTVEDGELTPTLKVRRDVVAERYREVVDGLYATT